MWLDTGTVRQRRCVTVHLAWEEVWLSNLQLNTLTESKLLLYWHPLGSTSMFLSPPSRIEVISRIDSVSLAQIPGLEQFVLSNNYLLRTILEKRIPAAFHHAEAEATLEFIKELKMLNHYHVNSQQFVRYSSCAFRH
jgi:hypothetical protein